MTLENADFAPVRFSSTDLPARDQVAIAREVFGRQIVGLDMEPLDDAPFQIEATLRRLPALRVGTHTSPALRVTRSPELIADNDDMLCLVMELGEISSASSQGRDATLEAGQGLLIDSMEPCVTLHSNTRTVAVAVPRAALNPLVAHAEDATIRTISADNEALHLLPVYLRALCEEMPLADAELCRLATVHVHDLIALAIGATRDGAALAKARGLRAARQQQVLSEIRTGFAAPQVSAVRVAERLGISARYVHDLLQETGRSFTEHVLELRLQKARAMLANPQHVTTRVSEIAYACGFNEVSYFNRRFRRRFGCSPTEYRT